MKPPTVLHTRKELNFDPNNLYLNKQIKIIYNLSLLSLVLHMITLALFFSFHFWHSCTF